MRNKSTPKPGLLSALVVSCLASGCATTLGYVSDHPDPDKTTDYAAVKEWAYGVSDGYSSRMTMNRYSLYWGATAGAAAAGAMTGFAAFGGGSHANIIIPITATFIGTLFGIYQNEELAQIYSAAGDSIKALANNSDKRIVLANNETAMTQLDKALAYDMEQARHGVEAQEKAKEKIHRDSQALNAPSQETISFLGKAIDEADAKIRLARQEQDLTEVRQANLSKLLARIGSASARKCNKSNDNTCNADELHIYEAGCLKEDVDSVMRKVQVHLALLDPQHVSEDLKNIKAPAESKAGATENQPPAAKDKPDEPVVQRPVFDLSDLDPGKIRSVCDVGE